MPAGNEEKRGDYRVLDIGAGYGQHARAEIERRNRGRFVEYFPLDEMRGNRLDFQDPDQAEKEIRKVVGRKKLDEIHVHMLEWHWSSESAPGILAVLSRHLKAGGKIFHSFEERSPLLPLKLESGARPRPEDAKAHERNREAIQREAERSGLKLTWYALAPFALSNDSLPVITPASARLRERDERLDGESLERANSARTAAIYHLVKRYSNVAHLARNLAVFEKVTKGRSKP